MDKPARLGRCLLVALLFCGRSASAAPEAPPQQQQPWTLDYCIRTAVQKHGSALSALDRIDAAHAQTRSASSTLFYPTFSGRSTRTEGYQEAQQKGSTVRRVGSTSDEQHILSMGVTLYDGGMQLQSVRQARAGESSAQATLRSTQQSLAYEVTNAYINTLKAQHTLGVVEEQLKQAQGQKEMVEARIKADEAAPVDVYPIDAQIASARVNRLAADSQVRVATLALRKAMGLEAGTAPQLAEMPDELPEPPPLEKCLERALVQRPDVQQAEAGLARSRAGLEITKLRLRPQITSTARLDRGLFGSSILNQWSVNAGLSWSFYSRGDKADVDASKAGLRADEEDRAQLLKDIASDVEQAHLALASARERVDAAKASVLAAQKSLEVAEAKYAAGLAIPLEIIDAQVARSNAELQAIQARYDYFLARAQLDRAMGVDVTP